MAVDAGVDGVLDPILEWFREIEDCVPGIFGRILRFLVDIPQGSEVGMYNLAEAYGNAAQGMSDHLDSISALNDPIASSWGGDGAVAFQEYWGGYIEQVTNSIASLTEMQGIVQDVGLEIEMAKYMAALNLYMLADAIFTILSTAAITFGLSTVAAPAAEAACEAGIKSAGRTLLEKILGQKLSSVVGDFAQYLGEKALPTMLKDGGSTLAKDAGENLLKDAGENLVKDGATDLGRSALTDAATTAATDATSTAVTDAATTAATEIASDVAADATRTTVVDIAKAVGGKIVDAGKFVAERLSLRGIAARGIADRAAAAFAKDQLESGLVKTLGDLGRNGLLKTVTEGLADKGATALVREAAYQSALGELRGEGLGQVAKMVGKEALHAAMGGARGFVEFQLKTTIGFTALQWAEGRNPHLNLVSLGEEALSGAAIGAFGGPLTTLLGHGIVGSMASMAGGTAAVDGIKTAMGQKVDWARDLQSSLAFGGLMGSQHGIGEVGGHLLDRAFDRAGIRTDGLRGRDLPESLAGLDTPAVDTSVHIDTAAGTDPALGDGALHANPVTTEDIAPSPAPREPEPVSVVDPAHASRLSEGTFVPPEPETVHSDPTGPPSDHTAVLEQHETSAPITGHVDQPATDQSAHLPEVRAEDLNLPSTRLDEASTAHDSPTSDQLAAGSTDPGGAPLNPVEARRLADHHAHLDDTGTSAHQSHGESGTETVTEPRTGVGTGVEFSVEAHVGPSLNFDPNRNRFATDLPRDVHQLVDQARSRLLANYPVEAVAERIRALDHIDVLASDLQQQAVDARTSGDLRDLVGGVRALSRAVNDYSRSYDTWRDFGHGGRPADPGWRDLDGVDPLNSTEMANRMVSIDPALHHLDVLDRAIAIAKIGDVLGPEFEQHAERILERAIPRSMESAEARLGPDVARDLQDAINDPYARGVYDARIGVTVLDTMDQGQHRSVSAVAATIVHESMHVLQPNLHLLNERILDAVSGRTDGTDLVKQVRAQLVFEREFQAFTVQQHFLRGLAGFRDRLDGSDHLQMPNTDRYQQLADETPEATRDRVIRDYIENRPQFDFRDPVDLLGDQVMAADLVGHNPELAAEHIVAQARLAIMDAYRPSGDGTPGGLQGPQTRRIVNDLHIDLDAIRTQQRDLHFSDVRTESPPEFETVGPAGTTVIHASAVPGDTFTGTGATADAAHAAELLRAVPEAITRAVEGHGNAEIADLGQGRYRIDLPDGGSFTVRVETQWLGPDAAAESHLNHDKDQHVIQLSDELRTEHVERALAHEIGEIIADRDRYLRGEPGNSLDALRPGPPEPGARLSPHDAGRVQELRVLGAKLNDLPPAGARTPEQELAYQRLLRSSLALVDHLGLRAGEPGAMERRDLVIQHADPGARAAIERALAEGGRPADAMSDAERDTWAQVRADASVDRARTAGWHDGLRPRFQRPVAFDGRPVGPAEAQVLAEQARQARAERSAGTLADLRARIAALAPGEHVHVRLQAGGGASLSGRDPRALLVDFRGRWQSDNGTVIAQTADQLRNLNRTGLGDPYQFVQPGERVPLDAVSYWEDSIAAQGPVIDGAATLRIDEHGALLVDVVPADGSDPITLAVDGVPMISTGFPPEGIIGVDRSIGSVRDTFAEASRALRAIGSAQALGAKAEIDALPWQDTESASRVGEILAGHGLDPSVLPERVMRSVEAIDSWHRMRQVDPGRVLTGDEANLRRDSSADVSHWVVAGIGGTAISGVENMLRGNPDSTFTMVGYRPPPGLGDNTQWKQVRGEHDLGYDSADPGAPSRRRADGTWPNPDASGRLSMEFGHRIGGVEVSTDAGGNRQYSVEGFTGDGVIVSLGGRPGVPGAIADLVDRALKADPDSVDAEMMFDASGHYVGYRMTVAGHVIDVTGAASRFFPGEPIFEPKAGRVYDHPPISPYDPNLWSTSDHRYALIGRDDPNDLRPAQSASLRDAPPESGNFDGGYVSTAVQVSHYAGVIGRTR